MAARQGSATSSIADLDVQSSSTAGRTSPSSSSQSNTANTTNINTHASINHTTNARSTQQQTPRPWWQPPPRNFRPHPGNHAISSYMATTSLVVAESTAANSEQQHSVYQESLPYYWFRALHYILRIPFRELIGNVARPYDPTTPLPLQDVPISATIIDTRTQIAFANPYTGRHNSNNNNNDNTNLAISISTTRSRHYLQQIRKAWRDRTSSMSWAFATAFFTSAICTVLVVVALMLNWGVPSIYLKIFLIAFVVRKWIATTLLVDRALYRLPLNLTEPDPDIDDERQNFAAIYMSQLFTWHGYAMLIFGQLFVFIYATTHYLSTFPIITGVALGFACMGLVPFFALLSLLLLVLLVLYLAYIVMYIILWPLNYWSLVQRRAISRMNGGYRSEGTTNTTDLNQITRSLEEAEAGDRVGFGATDHLKLTPAMKAIPIVIYKKPNGHSIITTPSIVATRASSRGLVTSEQPTLSSSRQHPFEQDQMTQNLNAARSGRDTPVAIPIPRAGINSNCDTQSDFLNRMSNNLSVLYSSPPLPPNTSPQNGRSRSSTVSRLSANISNIPPCVSGQEMNEIEARLRPVSLLISSQLQSIPSESGIENENANIVQTSVTPNLTGSVALEFLPTHHRSYSASHASSLSRTYRGGSHLNIPSSHEFTQDLTSASSSTSMLTSALPVQPAIGSLPPPTSLGTPSLTSLRISPSLHSASLSIVSASMSVAESSPSSNDNCPQQRPEAQTDFSQSDEECAICLCDFEDGDELRHLYCNHLFHRNCIDRWLVKNAFCPKCKRGI